MPEGKSISIDGNPKWMSRAVRIVDEEPEPDFRQRRSHLSPQKKRLIDPERFKKRYGIALVGACLFTLYSIILSASVHAVAVRQVRAELETEYTARLEAYKADQALEEQKSHFLSGDASREAAINQAVDSVAKVISKLALDPQKATEACCILARVMNKNYPNSFQEVCQQEGQWMFYDPSRDSTFSESDREIADKVRDF